MVQKKTYRKYKIVHSSINSKINKSMSETRPLSGCLFLAIVLSEKIVSRESCDVRRKQFGENGRRSTWNISVRKESNGIRRNCLEGALGEVYSGGTRQRKNEEVVRGGIQREKETVWEVIICIIMQLKI